MLLPSGAAPRAASRGSQPVSLGSGLLPRSPPGALLETAIQGVRRRRSLGSVDGVPGQPSGLYASAGQRFGPPLAGTSLKLPPRTLGNLYVGRRLFFAAAGGPHGCLPRLGAGDLGPEARATPGGPLDASVPGLFGDASEAPPTSPGTVTEIRPRKVPGPCRATLPREPEQALRKLVSPSHLGRARDTATAPRRRRAPTNAAG